MLYQSKKLVLKAYLMDATFKNRETPDLTLKTEPPEWVQKLMMAYIIRPHKEVGEGPIVAIKKPDGSQYYTKLPTYICQDLLKFALIKILQMI